MNGGNGNQTLGNLDAADKTLIKGLMGSSQDARDEHILTVLTGLDHKVDAMHATCESRGRHCPAMNPADPYEPIGANKPTMVEMVSTFKGVKGIAKGVALALIVAAMFWGLNFWSTTTATQRLEKAQATAAQQQTNNNADEKQSYPPVAPK